MARGGEGGRVGGMRRLGTVAVWLGLVGGVVLAGGRGIVGCGRGGAGEIESRRLQSNAVDCNRENRENRENWEDRENRENRADGRGRAVVVEFAGPVGAGARAELEAAGARVVGAPGGGALGAEVPAGAEADTPKPRSV